VTSRANERNLIGRHDPLREKRPQSARRTVERDGWRRVEYLGHAGLHSALVRVETASNKLKRTAEKLISND
jgi:hypothetical protein